MVGKSYASSSQIPRSVLLVDDYVPVRITLRSVLRGYVDLQIVGEACDGRQAIEQVAACQPDIILMVPKTVSATRSTSRHRHQITMWSKRQLAGLVWTSAPGNQLIV